MDASKRKFVSCAMACPRWQLVDGPCRAPYGVRPLSRDNATHGKRRTSRTEPRIMPNHTRCTLLLHLCVRTFIRIHRNVLASAGRSTRSTFSDPKHASGTNETRYYGNTPLWLLLTSLLNINSYERAVLQLG